MYRQLSFAQVPGMDAFSQGFMGGFLGGMVGFVVALGILLALVFFAALYIYHALAWQTVARKFRHKYPWLAWIPFANFAQILQLGGFHWAWIFLALIPILGWIALMVIGVIALWRICDKLRYPGWFSLGAIIPKVGPILYFVLIGFLAWGKKK